MKCKYCGREMVKHIIKEGARYHVLSWYKGKFGALEHCSEPDCERNHGEGHCVPYSEDRVKKTFFDFDDMYESKDIHRRVKRLLQRIKQSDDELKYIITELQINEFLDYVEDDDNHDESKYKDARNLAATIRGVPYKGD